jgi:ElaB/YqjD/DUF883 family membrane-anchored ribosome-binding protein
MNESEMAPNDVTMKKLVADFKLVLQDAEALAKATAGDLGEKVKEARARLASSMESAKETYHKVEEKAAVGVKATDQVIREHPYESIGVAFGIGLLIGVLVGRK